VFESLRPDHIFQRLSHLRVALSFLGLVIFGVPSPFPHPILLFKILRIGPRESVADNLLAASICRSWGQVATSDLPELLLLFVSAGDIDTGTTVQHYLLTLSFLRV